MPEPLRIKAGFCPYDDGSGFAVNVDIWQEYEGDEPGISINVAYKFEASKWPEVRDGIDRLLMALPPHNLQPEDRR